MVAYCTGFEDEWYRGVALAGGSIPPGGWSIAVAADGAATGVNFALLSNVLEAGSRSNGVWMVWQAASGTVFRVDRSTNLVAWTNARVGKQQRVSRIVLRDSLPRNPNGKLLKRELRAEYVSA